MVSKSQRLVVIMFCRSCNSSNLFKAIDLGSMPIAGEFLPSADINPEEFEVAMYVCKDCGLGQISEDASEERLFVNYNWRSSTSRSTVEHGKDLVDDIRNLEPGDWVLEIASNDGYLLKMFLDKGVDVLGVDPAKNIALYALANGVPTIAEFFTASLAKELLRIKGYPRLIIANNVMAHVPDIQDFMHGLSILSGPKTYVAVENPSIMNIMNKLHFDTIFHEHFSYLSATAVNSLATRYGLNLFSIDQNSIHGGSNRYWLSRMHNPYPMVASLIEQEKAQGLIDELAWGNTYAEIEDKVSRFKNAIDKMILDGRKICGYTASAKSTVLLNFAKVTSDQIVSVADDVLEKQGMFIPGANIPVVSMEKMLSEEPTDIIVFSWNILDEIKEKIKQAGYNVNVWAWTELGD